MAYSTQDSLHRWYDQPRRGALTSIHGLSLICLLLSQTFTSVWTQGKVMALARDVKRKGN